VLRKVRILFRSEFFTKREPVLTLTVSYLHLLDYNPCFLN